MSVAWDRDSSTPDVPVVDASLWKGVAVALVPSLAAWYALIRLVGWLAS
jgi:hypothetical protein